MSRKLLDRLVTAFVFGTALLLYGSTVAPTVAFWDAGEFIASAHTLQPVNASLRTPSEKEGRNAYYLLPLLLGFVGAVYHFARDERRALAVLALFLATGLGIVVYLNQTPMQPRPVGWPSRATPSVHDRS